MSNRQEKGEARGEGSSQLADRGGGNIHPAFFDVSGVLSLRVPASGNVDVRMPFTRWRSQLAHLSERGFHTISRCGVHFSNGLFFARDFTKFN